ncbi:MAG: ABC transporter permease subunit [Candidatus Methanomethyliaceae archaeon]
MSGMFVIFRKELADNFVNKRFLMIFALVLFLSTASAYQGASSMRESQLTNFLFIFTTGTSGTSFISLMVLFGPLLGLTISFDAINRERKSGTLSTVLTQPIFRDSIINGKFLAGAVTLSSAILGTMAIMMGISIPLLGFGPTAEQLMAILYLAILTILYLCFWFGIGLLFSVLSREPSTSILASIGTWVTFSILIFIISGFVVDLVAPLPYRLIAGPTNATGPMRIEFDRTLMETRNVLSNTISSLSPAYLYSEAALRIMGSMGGSFSFTGFRVSIPAGMGSIRTFNLAEALSSTWPHFAVLSICLVVCFVAAYIRFLRYEIRPGG